MCPEYLSKFLTLKKVPVNLRSENNLMIPKYKQHLAKITNYNSPVYLNASPNDAKKANSLYSCKSHIREWLPKCKCGFCIYAK